MSRYTAQEIRTAVQRSICEDNIAEMLLQYADELEREKKYEYAVRMDSGEVYRQFHDITEARDEAEFVNSDGLIICHAVRREVGEWEEVSDG